MTPETIRALKRAEAAERELRRLELALERANEEIANLKTYKLAEDISYMVGGAGI